MALSSPRRGFRQSATCGGISLNSAGISHDGAGGAAGLGWNGYRAIADELTAEIHAGVYDDGTPFPSESALVTRFGRAIMTVRRSLEVLRERGLITTEWGRGSWVVPADQRPAPTE
ncbi:GntR family transcriptional regulator [Kitasatospora sp. NPDC048545]|uniref:GntR family transcriptional regulator n=1 Tax=Kitasatospora sp. NPDC048545 TaxID=3157208 RepID=UPI0033CA79AD